MAPTTLSHEQLHRLISPILHDAARLIESIGVPASTEANPSTQIDMAIHDLLSDRLATVVDLPILSEEDAGAELPGGWAWVIDPLDGTLNAIVGSGDVAISVAIVDIERLEAIYGAVLIPGSGLLFDASLGSGAYRNGTRISLDGRAPAREIVGIGLPGEAAERPSEFGRYFAALIERGLILRQTGSAAIDICRVVQGQWVAFHEFGLRYWDVAAADLIASEAGCRSVMTRSRLFHSFDLYAMDYLVAATDDVLERLVAIVDAV